MTDQDTTPEQILCLEPGPELDEQVSKLLGWKTVLPRCQDWSKVSTDGDLLSDLMDAAEAKGLGTLVVVPNPDTGHVAVCGRVDVWDEDGFIVCEDCGPGRNGLVPGRTRMHAASLAVILAGARA